MLMLFGIKIFPENGL